MPDLLYKYCAQERLDILANQQIAFSTRSALNDPFELRPRVTFNSAQRAREGRKLPDRFKNIKLDPESPQEQDERMVNSLMEATLVLCLSKAWDIIPMWSYYGQSHTGFVIGLNTKHPFFSGLETRAVHYSAHYPTVDIDVKFREAFFHKFKQWKHEQEWRCLRIRHSDGEYSFSHPPCVTNVFLYSLPPAAVGEIILGVAMAPSCKEWVINRVSDKLYRHVRVYEAVRDTQAWRLDRREIRIH